MARELSTRARLTIYGVTLVLLVGVGWYTAVTPGVGRYDRDPHREEPAMEVAAAAGGLEPAA